MINAYIVGHRLLRRVELLVVGAAALRMEQSAGDAANEQLVVDAELDHGVQRLFALLQQCIQLNICTSFLRYDMDTLWTGGMLPFIIHRLSAIQIQVMKNNAEYRYGLPYKTIMLSAQCRPQKCWT